MPTVAGASGFALLEQSASRLGTAFAGTGAAADDAWGFNVGALFDLSDQTRVGLSYRSSIEYTVRGTLRDCSTGSSIRTSTS